MAKHITQAVVALFSLLAPTVASAQGSVYHRGYTRSDGTYVAPHHQSAPDGSRFNNWSSQGNVNPYTGRPGTTNPFAMPAPDSSTTHRRTWP